MRPPGVLSTVGLPPAGGGAARLQPGCSLAGVVLASELLTDVPAVPWTHKRTTNTHCGYRGSAAPGVFCPGVFVDYGCHWHREFLGERGRSSRSLRLLQCDSSFPRKPVVPLFHLTEKYARVERNRVYQQLEITEKCIRHHMRSSRAGTSHPFDSSRSCKASIKHEFVRSVS